MCTVKRMTAHLEVIQRSPQRSPQRSSRGYPRGDVDVALRDKVIIREELSKRSPRDNVDIALRDKEIIRGEHSQAVQQSSLNILQVHWKPHEHTIFRYNPCAVLFQLKALYVKERRVYLHFKIRLCSCENKMAPVIHGSSQCLHFKTAYRQIHFREGNSQLPQSFCSGRLFREVKHGYCHFIKYFEGNHVYNHKEENLGDIRI